MIYNIEYYVDAADKPVIGQAVAELHKGADSRHQQASAVTHDVPANILVAGNPVRIIRKI